MWSFRFGKNDGRALLAQIIGSVFYDADDFHSAANIEKMRSGVPLDDDDRREWLSALREIILAAIDHGGNAVLACSALKAAYREYLAVDKTVKFVLLEADVSTIETRLANREGHFMNPELLASQFETLEKPDDESIILDASLEPARLVEEITRLLFLK